MYTKMCCERHCIETHQLIHLLVDCCHLVLLFLYNLSSFDVIQFLNMNSSSHSVHARRVCMGRILIHICMPAVQHAEQQCTQHSTISEGAQTPKC